MKKFNASHMEAPPPQQNYLPAKKVIYVGFDKILKTFVYKYS